MHIVEFRHGPDLNKFLSMMAQIPDIARYASNIRVAVDEEGFKVSVDYSTWTPGFGYHIPGRDPAPRTGW